MARACIFCGSRENLNREDLWPKWLVETVTQDRPSEIERIFGSDSTAHFYGGKWVKGRGVCEQCNGGWMSNLESKIKLILEPMIFDSSSVLDYVQQSAIAIWTLKTAMAFECIKGAASTPEQRMRFSIPPLIDSIYNLPSTMSAFVLGAVISSAIGVVAVSIRALESEEAKAKRLELRRQKELRALTERISAYARTIHQRSPSGDVVVSECDLAEQLRKRTVIVVTALDLLLNEQKVQRAPLSGYWKLNA
jgi:hypothetical protein